MGDRLCDLIVFFFFINCHPPNSLRPRKKGAVKERSFSFTESPEHLISFLLLTARMDTHRAASSLATRWRFSPLDVSFFPAHTHARTHSHIHRGLLRMNGLGPV